MRRSTVVPLAIFVFALLVIGFAVHEFWLPETGRISNVAKIANQPSAIYATLVMQYDRPPVYQERYAMQDVEGVSSFSYTIRTYAGKQITLEPRTPEVTTQVSFFFGKLVLDGVWDLMDKPPRGNTHVRYTVYVKQKADFKEGDRTIVFTDPHYWATTAGRQYEIDLRKTNPNDLLTLKSTQLADPRYQKVVDDFLTFGPPSFRKNVARIRSELMKAAK